MAEKKKASATEADKKAAAEERNRRVDEVMVPRVNNLLEAFRILGNCANPATYNVTKEVNKKIFDAINTEYHRVKKLFDDAADGKSTKEIKAGFSI